MVMYSGKRKAKKLKRKQSIYTKNSAPGNGCVHRVWISKLAFKTIPECVEFSTFKWKSSVFPKIFEEMRMIQEELRENVSSRNDMKFSSLK